MCLIGWKFALYVSHLLWLAELYVQPLKSCLALSASWKNKWLARWVDRHKLTAWGRIRCWNLERVFDKWSMNLMFKERFILVHFSHYWRPHVAKIPMFFLIQYAGMMFKSSKATWERIIQIYIIIHHFVVSFVKVLSTYWLFSVNTAEYLYGSS